MSIMRYDSIIVLSHGIITKSKKLDFNMTDEYKMRLDYCFELFNLGIAKSASLSGKTHKSEKFYLTLAEAGKRYLLSKGLKENEVFMFFQK